MLIAAVAELTGRYPAMKAYIAGEGPYQSALTAQIREKKIADRVVLIGKRPHAELNSWFNAANVSCLLSEREGWPNVLLESLAAGTPVIATRAGGIAEVIATPALGTLVERNVPAITAALDAALKHEWDRPALVAYAAATHLGQSSRRNRRLFPHDPKLARRPRNPNSTRYPASFTISVPNSKNEARGSLLRFVCAGHLKMQLLAAKSPGNTAAPAADAPRS